MGALQILTLALTHPNEFRILLQFWNYYEPKRDITKKEEHSSSGWDRPTMRRCWELLDHSSRSFAAVIKELDGDLARVVSPLLHFQVLYSYNIYIPSLSSPSREKKFCVAKLCIRLPHSPSRYASSMWFSADLILSRMT